MKTMWYELKAGCPAAALFGESLAIAFTAHLLPHYSFFRTRLSPTEADYPRRPSQGHGLRSSQSSRRTDLRQLAHLTR